METLLPGWRIGRRQSRHEPTIEPQLNHAHTHNGKTRPNMIRFARRECMKRAWTTRRHTCPALGMLTY